MRNTLNSAFLLSAISAIMIDVIPVFASTQGLLGPSSTGSIGISVTKVSSTRISGLNDMIVSWSAADNDIVWTNDLCVFSSRAQGAYSIKASGSAQSGGAFVLTGAHHSLPYDVTWNAGGIGNLSNSGVHLSANMPSGLLSGAATDNSNCNGNISGPTARLVITIPKQSLLGVAPGSYADTLTLLVSPN